MSETSNYPESLLCNGRAPIAAGSFGPESLFFRGFARGDLDGEGLIRVETLQSPALSCNTSLFSKPTDVRFRVNSTAGDGCYQFGIEAVRFNGMANAVHDPLCDCDRENYSHCELRSLRQGEAVTFEPPRGRKRGKGRQVKERRLAWRLNLRNSLVIVLDAEQDDAI